MANKENLDIDPLKNAVNALKASIDDYDEYSSKGGTLKNTLRSGVIQNFEVAYELSWKFMKRWLSFNVSPELIDGIPRFELFKHAAEKKLISKLDKWFDFHKARNRTVHEYSETTADEVLEFARDFIPYAKEFIEKLGVKL
jgi:nucleotidyltransferase substrate binding protein (TIGR01987 family)